MTKISLNSEIFDKYNISIGEILYLLVISNNINLIDSEKILVDKGYIGNDIFNKYFITNQGKEILNNVILDSDNNIPSDKELLNLCDRLKKLYPVGKKLGTNQYWTESNLLISKRLRTFFKKYGLRDFEQIYKATETYINSFNSDYSMMRILKYFIFKEKANGVGDIESTSDLLNILENGINSEENNVNWTSSVN